MKRLDRDDPLAANADRWTRVGAHCPRKLCPLIAKARGESKERQAAGKSRRAGKGRHPGGGEAAGGLYGYLAAAVCSRHLPWAIKSEMK
jgi:hypothetical protein